jgi:hypothetical protein
MGIHAVNPGLTKLQLLDAMVWLSMQALLSKGVAP